MIIHHLRRHWWQAGGAAVPLKRHIATAALEAVEEEKIDKVN